MTRAEAYAAGYAEGERWAERDIQDRVRVDPHFVPALSDLGRATGIGARRGYRNTWARWDAGELTWEMLEHAPVGR